MKRPRGTGSFFVMSGPWEQRSPNDVIWLRYCKDGKVYRESTHTNKLNKAGQMLRDRLADCQKDTLIEPSARKVTIGELVTDLIKWYRTEQKKPRFAKDTESRWNLHLKAYFDDMRVTQLGTDQMRHYREQRMMEKASPVNINRELQVLRKAYKLAANASPPKVRTIPKFAMVAEDNARKVFMSEEVKQRLKDAAATDNSPKAEMKGLYLRAFVEMVFTLGWRKSEVMGLRVENIRLAEGFIRIEDSKNSEPREAPLTETLKVLIGPLVVGKRPTDPLFPVKDMRHAWKRLCKAAGIKSGKAEGYVIHDTRRTAARTKRSAGVSETVASKIMGWKPGSKMFARYGIVDRADMAEALQRSEQWEQNQKTVLAEFWQNQAETKPHTAPMPQPVVLPN